MSTKLKPMEPGNAGWRVSHLDAPHGPPFYSRIAHILDENSHHDIVVRYLLHAARLSTFACFDIGEWCRSSQELDVGTRTHPSDEMQLASELEQASAEP